MILPEEFIHLHQNKNDIISLKMPSDLKRIDVYLFNRILSIIGFNTKKRKYCFYHYCQLLNKNIIIQHIMIGDGMNLELYIDDLKIYKKICQSIKMLEVEYIKFLPFLISKMNEIINEDLNHN